MNQQCMYCHGDLEAAFVTRMQEFEGQWYVIENVPALVCSQCGETFLTPDAHDLVLQLITGKSVPSREIMVPVYRA